MVPVSGFYEWCRENGRKMPFFIKPHASNGLLLAGLWDRWHNREADEDLLSFTVLTTAAHDAMAPIHNRQPVMLSVAEARDWLNMHIPTADLAPLLGARLPVDVDAVPVSTYVNNARNKDERCVQPIGEAIFMHDETGPSSEGTTH